MNFKRLEIPGTEDKNGKIRPEHTFDSRLIHILNQGSDITDNETDLDSDVLYFLDQDMPDLSQPLHADNKVTFENKHALNMTETALKLVLSGQFEDLAKKHPTLLPRVKTILSKAEEAIKWKENAAYDEMLAVIDRSSNTTEDMAFKRLIIGRVFSEDYAEDKLPSSYVSAVEQTATFWAGRFEKYFSADYSPEQQVENRTNIFNDAVNIERKDVSAVKKRFETALKAALLDGGRSIVKITDTPDDLITQAAETAGVKSEDLILPEQQKTMIQRDNSGQYRVYLYRDEGNPMPLSKNFGRDNGGRDPSSTMTFSQV